MHMQNFVPTQLNATQLNATQLNAEAAHISNSGSYTTSESIVAFDGSDLSGQVANLQRADGLIRRYCLPDCDARRDALLEDAERVGWEALTDALSRAAAANSRPMLSVNYYRAMFAGGKGGGDADAGKPFGGYGAL